jgi:hypothetical protein
MDGFAVEDVLLQDESEREEAAANSISILSRCEEGELHKYLPLIIRLSRCCPFEDLRVPFTDFLQNSRINPQFRDLFKNSLCSYFIPPSVIPALSDERLRPIFEDEFLETGRISNIQRICAMHPTWLEAFDQTLRVIMQDDGPLPLPWRHYIGYFLRPCSFLLSFACLDRHSRCKSFFLRLFGLLLFIFYLLSDYGHLIFDSCIFLLHLSTPRCPWSRRVF